MIQFNKNAWEMQIQVTLCCKGMKPYMHPNRQLVISYMIGINDPFGIPNMQPFRVRTVFHGSLSPNLKPHRAAWWHHELTRREATPESFATDNWHVSICHPQTALRLAYLACLWWTSLDVAGKLAGLRKSVQFAVGSFQERPIQAHTYIELDWRGGLLHRCLSFWLSPKTVSKSATYLWSCLQRMLTPQTPPQVKKEGPERKQLKQTNGLGGEFKLEQLAYQTLFFHLPSNASMHCEAVLIKHHLHWPGIRATQNRRQKAKNNCLNKA